MSDRRERAIKYREKLNQFHNELDDVVLSLDVTRFREFYKKWHDLGIYDAITLPNDDILEITMRKMLVNMTDVPKDKYDEAKSWLLERGYDLEI